MTKGSTTWTFTYDANGMRTGRSPGYEQATYTYVYDGSKLSQMTVQGVTLRFAYDESGTPLTVTVDNSAVYYYKTNLQGDVIGILNSAGVQVVTYTYDAWGNVQILQQSDQIADYNPLLYRGYVYDQETGLYYLQSRYYNPEWGRFINADGLVATGQGLLGNNMFAYCLNCPTRYCDSSGTYSREAAVNYAEEWYDDTNEEYYHYTGGDCANFVSQCLQAGGIKETSGWYMQKTNKPWYEILFNPFSWFSYKLQYNWNISESWRLANEQYEYFKDPKNGYINGDVITLSSAADIASAATGGGIQAGDLVFFSTNGTSVSHAAMVSKIENGMIYYTAHTSSRFDHPLQLSGKYVAIFVVRICDDA